MLLKFPIKETVGIISSDPPYKEGHVRFTTVPVKALFVRCVQRYVCKRILILLYD